MDVGLHVVRFDSADAPSSIASTLRPSPRPPRKVASAQLTLMDHWVLEAFAPPTEPMLEGYTSLGYLAARTDTLTLGLLVTGVT